MLFKDNYKFLDKLPYNITFFSLYNNYFYIVVYKCAAFYAFNYLAFSLLYYFFLIGTNYYLVKKYLICNFNFLILASICLIFVNLCLHLWIINYGQYNNYLSICYKAFKYQGSKAIFYQSCLGKWARSAVFINKYHIPFYYLTVAYLEFAKGHDNLDHNPVKL